MTPENPTSQIGNEYAAVEVLGNAGDINGAIHNAFVGPTLLAWLLLRLGCVDERRREMRRTKTNRRARADAGHAQACGYRESHDVSPSPPGKRRLRGAACRHSRGQLANVRLAITAPG